MCGIVIYYQENSQRRITSLESEVGARLHQISDTSTITLAGRKEFCPTILRKIDEDDTCNFLRNISFNDEAILHVNSSVQKHNHFIYGYNNLHAIEEEHMKSPSIT